MSETDPRAFFQHEVIVTPEDIDELGHVNNAHYLRYVEACARAHAEREGLTLAAFRAHGALPLVHRHLITYHHPAGRGDRLAVSTRVTKMGGPRAERRNEVRLAETGELLAEVLTEWVWVDPESGRPKRAPEAISAAFGWST
ncbi:MAG TPA: thioesterase family protein [Trueperaceae bacterium]